jgi:hypothetical protein
MTPQQLIGVVIKLYSIWMIVLMTQALGLQMAASDMAGESLLSGYAAMLGFLLLAIFLWKFPMAVAHIFLARSSDDKKLEEMPRELAAAGCVIIGIIAIIRSFPLLTTSAIAAEMYIKDNPELEVFIFNGLELTLEFIAQFAIGVFLIKKCRFFAHRVI